jgi:hypothetical protein
MINAKDMEGKDRGQSVNVADKNVNYSIETFDKFSFSFLNFLFPLLGFL